MNTEDRVVSRITPGRDQRVYIDLEDGEWPPPAPRCMGGLSICIGGLTILGKKEQKQRTE